MYEKFKPNNPRMKGNKLNIEEYAKLCFATCAVGCVVFQQHGNSFLQQQPQPGVFYRMQQSDVDPVVVGSANWKTKRDK